MSLASAQAAKKAKPKIPKPPKVPLKTPTPQPGEKQGRGRPSAYSPEIADRLCDRIAMREPMTTICRDADMPCETTVYKWKAQFPEFAANLTRAREHRGEMRVDENDVVAQKVLDGEIDPNAGRVYILNNQWAAAREASKSYGDRLQADITSAGKPLTSASDLDIAKALAHALAAPALLAQEPIDAEAVPVEPEGEQP